MSKTSGQMEMPCIRNAAAIDHDLQLQSFYRRHQWFQLRDAVYGPGRHGFFRAAIACAFNEFPECLDYILPVIETDPYSQVAQHARDLLVWQYMRQGKFRSALAHCGPAPVANARQRGRHALVQVLAQSPEQSVLRHHSSVLRYEMVEGSMFIATTANGLRVNFMIDSGATISMMTQSMARRLALAVQTVPPEGARVYGATGVETAFRITTVAQLDIGECRLSNVAFIVLEDEPFGFPPTYAGVLGLPVLIALQTLSWNRTGEFHIASPRQARDIRMANICFDGPEPLINVAFRRQKLPLVLDTGNSATIFGPALVARFPALFNSQAKSTVFVSGVSGSAEIASLCFPEIALHVGGYRTIVAPAHMLLSTTTPNSNWSCGRLGIDCLNQAARITLDFHCMMLTLEKDENVSRAS